MIINLIIGAFIGIGVGIALQRGRGCTNTAFRNLLLIGNNEMGIMVVVVVVVELIGYFFLSFNFIPGMDFVSNPIPFSYLLIPIGGFIFGLGTVFAGGCAGGVCYRVGQGSVASLLSLFGFALGIGIVAVGPLAIVVNQIRADTTLKMNGQAPSLSMFLPRFVWTIIAVVGLLGLLYRHQKKKQSELDHLLPNWGPVTTGLIVGAMGIASRISSTFSGRSFGLSTTDGIGQIFQSIFLIDTLGWAGIFIIGLIGGSFIASLLGQEFRISVPSKIEFIRFLGGGLLLGTGAMIGLGCNFGHIFGGIPELGISSIVSVFFMVLGNWTASYFYYIKMGSDLPISTPQKLVRFKN